MASKRSKPLIDEQVQALRILREIGDWLAAHPGRSLRIRFSEAGWSVKLDASRRTSGQTIADALAQAAQTVSFDPEGGQ